MDQFAIIAILVARPGKESEVEAFLKSAQPLVLQEPGTTPLKFGIFDTFADENGRNAHLTGAIAEALFAKAEELFAEPPQILQANILACKI